MAAGHDLKAGQYDARMVSEDELWSAFSYLFSTQSKNSTSYKFGFLKSLIDNLYNVNENLVLTFDQLFSKFAESYWNLVLKYGIRQQTVIKGKSSTVLESVLHSVVEKYDIAAEVPFESLTDEMKLYVCVNGKRKCKVNVVGALYGDLKGLIYSFSKKEEWIQFSPYMYEFLCKHKLVIEKMNYYEWARYMEKVNDDSVLDHLLTKIEISTLRNNLSVYRHILFDEFESKECFYCGKPLREDAIHVDHFIPWSFIKDDQLWNFVLACPGCNESKNDKLPAITYLERIIERNSSDILLKYANMLTNYKSQKMRHIYNWAVTNGYNTIWTPSSKKTM